MLGATDLPTEDERRRALSYAAWRDESRQLAGKAYGLLRHQTAELIDVAVGTTHARAALVALQEGADSLFQAAIDIVDGSLAEQLLGRVEIQDPLGEGELLHSGEDPERLRKRALRVRLEDAAVRVASAGNHLVNAHLRLAWEANAATRAELVACGFDPTSDRLQNWAGVTQAAHGFQKAAATTTAVLPHFVLQPAFDDYFLNADVEQVRMLRDRIVHRDRPSYSDAPAIGRVSLWSGPGFKITFPSLAEPVGDDPSLTDTRETLGAAAVATLAYAEAIWDLALRWLRTVDVDVAWEPGQVTVQTTMQAGQTSPRFPRELRDPGAFLLT
jgi:hypothetical protein